MSTEQRIKDWMNGRLDDHELTKKDLKELTVRVNAAVAKKILSRDGAHVFPQHQTLQ